MGATPKLGILDLVPVRPGQDPGDAIRDTLRLAEMAERLGYHRYWLAEHHGSPLLACPSPELLAGQVAARTTRMRVGSGGVLLSHYSPLKVAENFRLLEALFPGRIDLGISRATAAGGAGAAPAAEFPQRVASVMAHLDVQASLDSSLPPAAAVPAVRTTPDVWLLGSGTESARVAATLGASFAFAHFITPTSGAEVIAAYRLLFRPSPIQPRPHASLAVSVVCAEDEGLARLLFERDAAYYARLELGDRPAYLSLGEFASVHLTDDERRLIEGGRARTVVGALETVRQMLLDLAAWHHADELVIRSISPDPSVRERTYRLVAEALAATAEASRAA